MRVADTTVRVPQAHHTLCTSHPLHITPSAHQTTAAVQVHSEDGIKCVVRKAKQPAVGVLLACDLARGGVWDLSV